MLEAITLTGQVAIRWIERKLNEFLNKVLSTEVLIMSSRQTLIVSTLILVTLLILFHPQSLLIDREWYLF